MKTLKRGQLVFDILLFLFLIYYIKIASTYSPVARAIPLIISIPIAFLLIFLIITDFVNIKKAGSTLLEGADNKEKKKSDSEKRAFNTIFLWIILVPFVVYILGFLLSIPILLILFLKLYTESSWKFCLISFFILELIIYVGLVKFLNINLYKGIIWLKIFGR